MLNALYLPQSLATTLDLDVREYCADRLDRGSHFAENHLHFGAQSKTCAFQKNIRVGVKITIGVSGMNFNELYIWAICGEVDMKFGSQYWQQRLNG